MFVRLVYLYYDVKYAYGVTDTIQYAKLKKTASKPKKEVCVNNK